VATNEAGRLRALRQYKILNTKPEQAFDDGTPAPAEVLRSLCQIRDSDRLL